MRSALSTFRVIPSHGADDPRWKLQERELFSEKIFGAFLFSPFDCFNLPILLQKGSGNDHKE